MLAEVSYFPQSQEDMSWPPFAYLIAEWSILQSTAYHQPIWAFHSQFLSGSFSKREFIFFSNLLENALGLGQPVNADTS